MSIDYSNPIPIYSEIDFKCEQNPFALSKAHKSIILQSPRCEEIKFIPHAHTTHLETPLHINIDSLLNSLPLTLNNALYTVVLDYDDLQIASTDERVEFAIIRKNHPKMIEFEGINPSTIGNIIKAFPNLEIIGINEPSFDPEDDKGAMLVHRLAFEKGIYLIELLNLDATPSNMYYCFLNLFRFGRSDAYPCCPVLYPIPAASKMALCDSCLFCKIIRGVIPSFKVFENNLTLAFLDINPLSEGHILVIPKFHGGKLHEITDEHLADILPVARRILLEGFGDNGASIIPAYNILQNNGKLAHQEVEHVHFHIIPKRSEEEGLGIKWPAGTGNMSQLAKYAEAIRAKIPQ